MHGRSHCTHVPKPSRYRYATAQLMRGPLPPRRLISIGLPEYRTGSNSAMASLNPVPPPTDCLRNATMPLLEAATRWYEERYNVLLDAKQEALMLIGSQEGLGE